MAEAGTDNTMATALFRVREEGFSEELLHYYRQNNQKLFEKSNLYLQAYRDHFSKNKKFLLEGAGSHSGSALVLGLGNGLDIPLEELATRFEKVVAVDMDDEAMSRALSRLPKKLQKKVLCIQEDLTGLMLPLSNKIDSILKGGRGLSWEDFAGEISLFLNSLSPSTVELEKADYTISSMVLLDLGSTLFEFIARKAHLAFFNEKPFNEVHDSILMHSDFTKALSGLSFKLQLQHINDLYTWTRSGGRGYLAYRSRAFTAVNGKNKSPQLVNEKGLALPNIHSLAELLFSFVEKKSWVWQVASLQQGSLHAIPSLIIEAATLKRV